MNLAAFCGWKRPSNLKCCMKTIVGIVGAVLIFSGVFLITGMFLLPVLPPVMQPTIKVGSFFYTTNLLGMALGCLAGYASYSATVAKKK